eukprot:GSMAST32.ASY1.ANO1.2405.1 assembled CDS
MVNTVYSVSENDNGLMLGWRSSSDESDESDTDICESSTDSGVSDLLKDATLLQENALTQECLDNVEKKLKSALHAASMSLDPSCYAGVRDRLTLLLCQQGESRTEDALRLLRSGGYLYRLSRGVLHYKEASQVEKQCSKDEVQYQNFITVLDNAIPSKMFRVVQEAFAPTSLFWEAHNYGSDNQGYFSYLHPLQPILTATKNANSNMPILEQLISHIYSLAVIRFPQLKNANFAEWWAHCRPHCSGHQMHYDSDAEGESTGTGPRHPILSTVLYLTDTVGGPTLVTTQDRRGSTPETLASHGWMSYPKINRLSMFDGGVLHGVIPGRENGQNVKSPRRITLMIAFWKDIKSRPRPSDGTFGASMLFPKVSKLDDYDTNKSMPCTKTIEKWLKSSATCVPLLQNDIMNGDSTIAQEIRPPLICPVWERVEEISLNQLEKSHQSNVDKSKKTMHVNIPKVSDLKQLPSYHLCFQGF